MPSLSEVLQEILCKITASQAKDGVRQSVTLVNGHSVRHVRRASRSGAHVERLKPGLRYALSESHGVCGQNGMLPRRILEFFVERVMPDVLHVVQISDERSRQTRRKDAQYLYTALGWRPPWPSW